MIKRIKRRIYDQKSVNQKTKSKNQLFVKNGFYLVLVLFIKIALEKSKFQKMVLHIKENRRTT